MSMTKGRIARTGRVCFHDASLAVWEEGISDARAAGGWEGEQRWEREFKRDVFARIVQVLRRQGWMVTMPPIKEADVKHYGGKIARRGAERQRNCHKGDLRGELSMMGRSIKFDMWQPLNTPNRPDYEGKYEPDKEAVMPYLIRLEMERTRRRIREYPCNVFTGYAFEDKTRARIGLMGVTAIESIESDNKASGHYRPDLGHAGGHDSPYNNRSADGGVVQHGARVWFADRKGRMVVGTARYNLGSMWWVVTGKYDRSNVSSHEIYVTKPDNLRVKRNASLRRQRLEKEMAKAVAAMQFERAAVLRDVLFPGAPALYVVWNNDHGLYHREGFCGYTADMSKAGRFTAEEGRGWDRAPNRIISITDESRKAA